MRNLSKIGAAVSLATVALAAATPADARWRGGRGYNVGRGYYGGGGYYGGRGWHRGGRGTGAAVAAGIIGLGVGAAIASSNRPYRTGYYGGGYGYGYNDGYYGGPAYYAPPPPPPAYYGGYCTDDWRWDGYRGRYVRVRYCD